MVAFYKRILLALVTLLSCAACQENGEIGDLFGQWQWQPETNVGDAQQQIYLSFQGKVALVKRVNADNHTYQDVFASYQHTGHELSFQFASIKGSYNDTLLIEQSLGFCPFADVRLDVVRLDAHELILEQASAGDSIGSIAPAVGQRWRFVKY